MKSIDLADPFPTPPPSHFLYTKLTQSNPCTHTHTDLATPTTTTTHSNKHDKSRRKNKDNAITAKTYNFEKKENRVSTQLHLTQQQQNHVPHNRILNTQ